MKLTKKKVRYIIYHKKKGESCDSGLEEYKETGWEPIIGNNLGKIIKKAFHRFKFGARMLEPVIDGIYNIPHDRLHMHMLSEG